MTTIPSVTVTGDDPVVPVAPAGSVQDLVDAAMMQEHVGSTTAPPPIVEAPPAAVDRGVDTGLAGRLQARLAEIKQATTREFGVPGWDGGVRLVCRMLDAADLQAGGGAMQNDAAIAAATVRVVIDDQTGSVECPGFGPDLAGLLGMPGDTPPDVLVSVIFSHRSLWVDAFAADLMAWTFGRRPLVEGLLGE